MTEREDSLLHGLVAAPFTPFDHRGNINLDTISTLIKLYRQNGVSGAFIAGSTGECASLSHLEKMTLLKTWSELKGQDLKTIFMIGGNCIREMQALAIAAQDHTYDAISLVSPYYFKPKTVAHLVQFCTEVLEPVPNMPFYYYHIPGLTGVDLPMSEFIEVASDQLPGFRGIKYSAPNLMDFHQCCTYENGRYEMLWGTDEALLASLTMGTRGAVGSTYNYMAPLYHEIINRVSAGDLEEAERQQRYSVKVVELLIKYGGIATGKAIMEIIGVDCGAPRTPNIAIGANDMKTLQKELSEIDFFDYCSKIK